MSFALICVASGVFLIVLAAFFARHPAPTPADQQGYLADTVLLPALLRILGVFPLVAGVVLSGKFWWLILFVLALLFFAAFAMEPRRRENGTLPLSHQLMGSSLANFAEHPPTINTVRHSTRQTAHRTARTVSQVASDLRTGGRRSDRR